MRVNVFSRTPLLRRRSYSLSYSCCKNWSWYCVEWAKLPDMWWYMNGALKRNGCAWPFPKILGGNNCWWNAGIADCMCGHGTSGEKLRRSSEFGIEKKRLSLIWTGNRSKQILLTLWSANVNVALTALHRVTNSAPFSTVADTSIRSNKVLAVQVGSTKLRELPDTDIIESVLQWYVEDKNCPRASWRLWWYQSGRYLFRINIMTRRLRTIRLLYIDCVM